MFSRFRRSFRQWARSGTRPAAAPRAARQPLQCEALEDRILLSLSGAEALVNTTKTAVQSDATSATANNGSSVVVWSEVKSSADRDVKAQRFDASGRKVGGEILVASGRTNQHDPQVAMDARGNFVVVWTHDWSPSDFDIHAARFKADGTRAGSEFTVAGTYKTEFDPSVSMADNGGFVVSYTLQFSSTDRDVKAVLYRADGTLTRSIDVAASTRVEEKSSVSMAGDGRFAVGYQSLNNVFVSRFAATGTRVGNHTVASSSVAEQEAAVAMDDRGNVLVVWQQQSGTNWNIAGRSISSAGVLAGVFTVASTAAQETLPSVAVDTATGKAVVAYQTQAGSTFGVNVAELSAARTVTRTSTMGTGLNDPFVSLGGSPNHFLVTASSIGKRGLDPDGGVFARYGVL
jgi:hypothetical protein